ncbi:MAG: MFS transporter, partial [Pseudogulbenkiania sp.]|nr:MFS transporter [Pseudogulbenkiania sp.]
IGAYADRAGRKPAMMLTLWLMAIGSAIFVVAPTYAQIGMAAPVLIVLGRLIQGFAIGGELGASTSLLLEYADDKSRGYYGSWQLFSQALSTLLGSLCGLALTNVLPSAALESWGWRVPFVLGMLVVPIGMYIRRHLHETADSTHATEGLGSVAVVFGPYRKQLIAGVLLVIGGTAANYIILNYMTNYAATVLHMPLKLALLAGLTAAAVSMLMAPFAGILSDRIGRKPAILLTRLPMLALIYPAFMLLNADPTLPTLLLVVAGLSLLLIFNSVPSVVILPELFPRRVRATGMSLVYCFGVLIFGGFAQFFATGLIKLTDDPNAPALYVIGCGLVSLIGWAMVRETAGRPLE